jgi:predicted nucleic acid-binding protein
MFGAKAAITKTLGCGVHLVTAGMMRRVRSAYRKPGESNVEFLARIAIIDTIVVRSELEAAGKPIPSNDLLIAAHASALGMTIVTANTDEFKRVRSLKVTNRLD